MRIPGFALVAVLLAATAAGALALQPQATAVQPACPTGTSPVPADRAGELFLPDGAIPFSRITIFRHTLTAGQTMPTVSDQPVMYIVESGEMHYLRQDGTSVYLAPSCVPAVAYQMAITDASDTTPGGTIAINEADQIRVTEGQSLVAEHGLLGPLRNGGTTPLVLLEVSVMTPEIDPASGLPIVDSVTAAREEERTFQLRKRACRERRRALTKGDPVAYLPVYLVPPEPTPAFTTVGWADGVERAGLKEPRACDGQNAPG